jgi:hypothetical protein
MSLNPAKRCCVGATALPNPLYSGTCLKELQGTARSTQLEANSRFNLHGEHSRPLFVACAVTSADLPSETQEDNKMKKTRFGGFELERGSQ